jgi:transcriptional regulator with XRE-family HTH domain
MAGETDGARSASCAFGRAVRRVRSAQGLSQEELGFKSGLDRTYISGIERGTRNPTLESLWRIARALNVPASDLIREAERNLGSD